MTRPNLRVKVRRRPKVGLAIPPYARLTPCQHFGPFPPEQMGRIIRKPPKNHRRSRHEKRNARIIQDFALKKMSAGQIAQREGMSEDAVQKILSRAKVFRKKTPDTKP